ncbi:MAG: ferritin-like domain-containing protein [Alphaproteobacteria bacterium]
MSKTDTISLMDLLARAYAIECEAVFRYTDLADQMEVHNNLELAKLFRKMAGIEEKHAEKIKERAGGDELPHISPLAAQIPGAPAPESVASEDMHYMMTPHHAIKLALAGEQQAAVFYEEMAKLAADAPTRAFAEEMAIEEHEHVKMAEDLLAQYPEPEEGWDEDDDPPEYQE